MTALGFCQLIDLTPPSPLVKARLRLQAAKSLLKLATVAAYKSLITPKFFPLVMVIQVSTPKPTHRFIRLIYRLYHLGFGLSGSNRLPQQGHSLCVRQEVGTTLPCCLVFDSFRSRRGCARFGVHFINVTIMQSLTDF